MMAVSGAFTALVDRVRHGPSEQTTWSEAELLQAIRGVTAEEFELASGASPRSGPTPLPGQATLPPPGTTQPPGQATLPPPDLTLPPPATALPSQPRTVGQHSTFLAALVAGGALSSLLQGSWGGAWDLGSLAFTQVTGGSPLLGVGVLFLGGLLVGAGTRMAGGCTSGHGLCGVSRYQPGSLVSTMVFFGTGIVVALLLARLA
jgi:uncharacterized protein